MSEPSTPFDAPEVPPPGWGQRVLRRWFFAGLLIWIPLAATLLVIRFLVNLLDTSLLLIPAAARPDIPGLGVILSVALVLGTGAIAANYLGSKLVNWGEELVGRIPLVRTLYGSVKKLAETLFSENSSSFKKVVAIEWPRPGQWSIGFQAGEPIRELTQRTGIELIPVFVPTTPSPAAGFIMHVPLDSVTVLDMSIEEGMRYVLSLGVVAPNMQPPTANRIPTTR